MPASSRSRRSRRSVNHSAFDEQYNEQPLLVVSVKSKVIALLLLLCSCWLMAYVAPIGLASAYYFKAEHYIALWLRKADTLDQASWQEAADAIEQAAVRHPQNPHYLLTQAKINEWAWYGGFKTAEQIAVNEQLYQQAMVLRPTWPNAYADYAYFLGMVNFRITEAFKALEQARQLGPYIPATFHRTFTIATHHWPLLNVEQKVQGFKALEEMMKTPYQDLYQQAVQQTKNYQLQRHFCLYLRLKKAEFSEWRQKQIEKDFCGVR